MALLPLPIVEHYRMLQYLELVAKTAARRKWQQINALRIKESWAEAVVTLEPLLAKLQLRAALSAVDAMDDALAIQGVAVEPLWTVNPASFGQVNTRALFDPAISAVTKVAGGMIPMEALRIVRTQLDRTVSGMISGSGNEAAQIEIAARPKVKYVRMCNPPSCHRCIILAGRVYNWNQGFERHPHCDCRHVPTTIGDQAEALANGLIDDPVRVFDQMDEKQIAALERALGKPSVAALRAGADWSQVVNAKRGQHKDGKFLPNFTSEGMARRKLDGTALGYSGSILKDGQRRATPKLLLEWSGGDRAEYQRLLTEHGYILPEGKTLRGKDYEGYGQMGRGGTRITASQAVLDARETGLRDPNNRYTMTAAERRVYDSALRAQAEAAGRNPYRSPDFGNTPDPQGWYTVGGYPRLATSGGGGKPPAIVPLVSGFDDDEPRPKATYGSAQHMLDRHIFAAPNVEGTTYYPKGFFGEFDDDIELARQHQQAIVDTAQPVEDEDEPGYLFTGTHRGITTTVPVRPTIDYTDWEVLSGWPVFGKDVEKFSDGVRYRLQ
jgi:hypothetical protein